MPKSRTRARDACRVRRAAASTDRASPAGRIRSPVVPAAAASLPRAVSGASRRSPRRSTDVHFVDLRQAPAPGSLTTHSRFESPPLSVSVADLPIGLRRHRTMTATTVVNNEAGRIIRLPLSASIAASRTFRLAERQRAAATSSSGARASTPPRRALRRSSGRPCRSSRPPTTTGPAAPCRPARGSVSPVNGQSAVARYATNGDTLAGSHTSKPSSGAFTTSDKPGVASVRRVRAAGAIAFERTP